MSTCSNLLYLYYHNDYIYKINYVHKIILFRLFLLFPHATLILIATVIWGTELFIDANQNWTDID